MRRQKVRKTLLFISMLLFPVTLNYLSPYLVIRGGFEGVVSGNALLFAGLFLSSLFFGRAYCGWLCPAGGGAAGFGDRCERQAGRSAAAVDKIFYMGAVAGRNRGWLHFCWRYSAG